jgi:Fe-S cluster assembly protein SufD
MVNDIFYDKELPHKPLPKGVIVCALRDAAINHPDFVSRYYGKFAQTDKDALVALNTMLVEDGLFVYVPRGVVVDRTLQIVNILRADVDLMVNRRVLIVAEESAQVRLLFCDHAVDDRNFLATQVMEVFAGPNSNIELYELEETHVKSKRFANLSIHQEVDSHVTHDSLTLHNGLTRNTTEVRLLGHGAEINLFGGVIADKQQHVDNNTLIDHVAEGCQSNELYKYVLDEQSVGAFAGKVLVRPGAQKTVSQETNANLCATREARMYSQPMLEIYADDVKCNHGSTVGQLNDAALFYMQQRGIPYPEARLLLEFAFMGEVIDNIKLDSLRDRLHYLVEKRFRGELNKCEGCRLCR